jgi:Mg2+-importing ATPase
MLLTNLKTGLMLSYAQEHAIPRSSRTWLVPLQLFTEALVHQCFSFFFILLVVSGGLSYALGAKTDAFIFWGITLINTLLGCAQEYKASKAGKLLEQHIKHTVTTRRNGILQEIESNQLLAGDLVYLGPGDIVVADIQVRVAKEAFVDESMRTGETFPISIKKDAQLFAGSNIVSGTIVGQVTRASHESSLMQYAHKVDHVKKNNDFSIFLSRISMGTVIIVLACLSLIALIAVAWQGLYSWGEFALFAVTMLVGVVPESLPLIVTLILSHAALRLAKEQVIVKHLPSLQVLGSIQFFLTDKTGTLTQNTLRVARVLNEQAVEQTALRVARGAYERTPMDHAFDNAIQLFFEKNQSSVLVQDAESPELIPFHHETGYATFTFSDQVIIRGQFQQVFDRCRPTASERVEIEAQYQQCESKGLRVIAFAKRSRLAKTFVFSGCLAFEDPLKADAKASYAHLERLGLAIKVLTGYSTRVATYVVNKLRRGKRQAQVFACDTQSLTNIGPKEYLQTNVFSRCKPEEKMTILNAYVEKGGVGFLGEGMNDALALKRADVGIVVHNACDIAKQSADMILMEKGLHPILQAVRLSRMAYAHVFLYLICTLTGNIGTLFSLSIVAMFSNHLPMLPVQILLNNLLTDVPLLLLITDRLDPHVSQKPIQHQLSHFFHTIVIFGALSSFFDLAYFLVFRSSEITTFRTGWLIFSVLCELTLVLSLRTKKPAWRGTKPSLPLAHALALCALVACSLPYLPGIRELFALHPLPLKQFTSLLGLVALYVLGNEGCKFFLQKHRMMFH